LIVSKSFGYCLNVLSGKPKGLYTFTPTLVLGDSMTDKIFKWKCPSCRKVIESIYKIQFEYNIEQHLKKHKEVGTNDMEKKD